MAQQSVSKESHQLGKQRLAAIIQVQRDSMLPIPLFDRGVAQLVC